MPRSTIDPDRLRVAIRRMKREELLTLLDRAIDLVPKSRLAQLTEGYAFRDIRAGSKPQRQPLLEQARAFERAAMRHEYYESFNVNSTNYRDTSRGTQRFFAELNLLIDLCVKDVDRVPAGELREAFEVLLTLLRRIDQGDEIVFFADEGGSWQAGLDWDEVLPSYFTCLAASAEPEQFGDLVVRAIVDFADYRREKLLKEARRVASKSQKTALRKVVTREQ